MFVCATIVSLVASASADASIIVWTEAAGGNGHAYEFVQGTLVGWEEASAAAQAMTFQGVSGHLATITSETEQLFLNSIPSLDPEFFPDAIAMWLGGFQATPSDPPDQGWAWVTGEAWSFTDWQKGEPNDAFKLESHLAMGIPQLNGPSSGTWSDQPGDPFMWFGISGFLVEYPVPAPGALAVLALAIACGLGRHRRSFAIRFDSTPSHVN